MSHVEHVNINEADVEVCPIHNIRHIGGCAMCMIESHMGTQEGAINMSVEEMDADALGMTVEELRNANCKDNRHYMDITHQEVTDNILYTVFTCDYCKETFGEAQTQAQVEKDPELWRNWNCSQGYHEFRLDVETCIHCTNERPYCPDCNSFSHDGGTSDCPFEIL